MHPLDEGLSLAARMRAVLASLLAIAETRIELLGNDVELQGARLRRLTLLLLAGSLMLALALVFASVLVIAIFWESHRLAAVVAVMLVYLLAGGGCLLAARRVARTGPRPFEATRAELQQDIAHLRR